MLDSAQINKQRQALAPQTLLSMAQKAAGLKDFGDTSFIQPMTEFLEKSITEVDFKAAGLQAFQSEHIRYLVNRLRTQHDLKKHPEILDEDISDPIIIIGLPRSGTTKLHRMMTTDPNVQKLFMWKIINPAPFPNSVPGQPDPRITTSSADGLLTGDSKEVQAGHAMSLNEVDEELILFDFTLDPSVIGFSGHTPFFFHEQWANGTPDRQADKTAYHYVRTLLQYLQWQGGGRRNRPWILKAVSHHPHMDTLLECFPKATLVHCHRDPKDSIPSMAKLLWLGWGLKIHADKQVAGRGLLEWGATGIKRYLEARNRLQLDDRILDVSYKSIRNNIMPVIHEAYQRAGWELTPEALSAMMKWEHDNEQGKHGHHNYSLDELGLNEEIIDTAFKDYIERFIS